ncbi:MAG: FAD-binding protein [Candidatus Coatesbacteria bacterium]|nr:MAG: FAD-binding protein [Candidatus Coatesbacteria bacterium]
MESEINPKIIKDLRRAVGSQNVRTGAEDLYVHSYDATAVSHPPDLVVVPNTADELASVCELLWADGVPLTPRGAGTGYSGGALPVRGGAVVVCDRLKNWTGPSNGTVTCEPGVIVDDLNRELKPLSLFYPVDPASSEASTVGGHLAENAGGPAAFKYGVTRDNVRSMEVINPARGREVVVEKPGELDLLSVLVGSEGTLAVTLRAELRVLARPPARAAALATFDGAPAAGKAAYAVISSGLGPAKLEFIGADCIKCILEDDPDALPADAGAVLLLEFDGSPEEVQAVETEVEEVLAATDARSISATADERESDRLWHVRRGISAALARLAPHKLNEDVCVPPSRVPAFLEFVEEMSRRLGLSMPTFGHVGDGNLHVNFMYDKGDARQAVKVEEGARELAAEVLALGGTISGEHGIGLSKLPFVDMELSRAEIETIRRVKAMFDPNDLLNPGKTPEPG